MDEWWVNGWMVDGQVGGWVGRLSQVKPTTCIFNPISQD